MSFTAGFNKSYNFVDPNDLVGTFHVVKWLKCDPKIGKNEFDFSESSLFWEKS